MYSLWQFCILCISPQEITACFLCTFSSFCNYFRKYLFVDSPCLSFMMRSVWSSIDSVFGFTSSKLIIMYTKVSSSYTELFASSAFEYPVLLLIFNLMIFYTSSMSIAYRSPFVYLQCRVSIPVPVNFLAPYAYLPIHRFFGCHHVCCLRDWCVLHVLQ